MANTIENRPCFIYYYAMKNRLLGFLILTVVAPLFPLPSFATPEFARQTGLQCADCHLDPSGGSRLTERGTAFREELTRRGEHRSLTTTQHFARLIIGYLHMMAAIIWFGAILYIHILLKPAYASRGLPKGELRLGWVSMLIVLLSGILLTIARMPSWESFYTTRFGLLLSIKIALFLIMLSSAFVVTVFVGPRMRQKRKAAGQALQGEFSPEALSQCDGKEGRPAYFAYKDMVYDVSQSTLWKNGSHMVKHAAGQDLTEVLKNAPHGEEKVFALPQVGRLARTAAAAPRPFHERLFYFFAYMNLSLTFVIIFIISLWRWW